MHFSPPSCNDKIKTSSDRSGNCRRFADTVWNWHLCYGTGKKWAQYKETPL